MYMQKLPVFAKKKTKGDGLMDRRIDGPTDRLSGSMSCVYATKKKEVKEIKTPENTTKKKREKLGDFKGMEISGEAES